MVKREQERAEEEHRKEMEERRRRKLHQQRIKRVLEAAFDGDNDEILVVLKEVSERGPAGFPLSLMDVSHIHKASDFSEQAGDQ